MYKYDCLGLCLHKKVLTEVVEILFKPANDPGNNMFAHAGQVGGSSQHEKIQNNEKRRRTLSETVYTWKLWFQNKQIEFLIYPVGCMEIFCN